MSGIEQNKQLAKTFFRALGSYDLETLGSIISDDVILNVENKGCLGGRLSKDQLPMVGQLLGAACPEGITFEILDLTAEEDRVAVRIQGHGKTPDGGEYNNRYHFLLKFREGKICETFEYMDSLLLEEVFGPILAAQSARKE